MNKLLIILFILSTNVAAKQICYEADKTDISLRTQWSHTYFVIETGPKLNGPDGKLYRQFFGYGYNQAPTPNGGFDTVPFSGSAVKDVDGKWLVSLIGTLRQQSMLDMFDHNGRESYWIISQNWILNPDGTGTAIFGNLIEPFQQHLFKVTNDDRIEMDIWKIPCDNLKQ